VDKLSSQQEDFDPAKHTFDTEYIDLMKPTAAHLAVTSSEVASRPFGHGATHAHRGPVNRVVTTIVPNPVKGATPFANVSSSSYDSHSQFQMN